MMAVDPNEATAEERENGITKLRYMEFREIRSSSRNLGFRIEGVKRSNEEPNTDFKTVNSREDAIRALDSFLPERGSALRKVVVGAFCDRLEDLRDGLARSDFFAVSRICLLILISDTANRRRRSLQLTAVHRGHFSIMRLLEVLYYFCTTKPEKLAFGSSISAKLRRYGII